MSKRRRPRSITKAAPQFAVGNVPAVTFTAEQVAALTAARRSTALDETFTPLPREPQALFGPGIPVQPAPLDQVDPITGRPQPRIWEYPVSSNLPGVTDRLIPWKVLREAAEAPLVRDCIRIRKNMIASLGWDIVVSKRALQQYKKMSPDTSSVSIQKQLRTKLNPDTARLLEFWEKPDFEQGETFVEWAGKILEEHLVLDAVALYPFKSRGGDRQGFRVLDGSTIKVLLNKQGGRPMPPFPAYQQVLWGFPRGEWEADTDGDGAIPGGYDSDRLVYRRREVRTFTPYGFCYDADTEILTRVGWRHFADLTGSEEVATRSPSGDFEWQQPTDIIEQPYAGPMLKFRSQVIDLVVTPNHRMAVHERSDATRPSRDREFPTTVREARWFAEAPGRCSNWQIPLTSNWKGHAPKYVVIPAAVRARGRHHPAPELLIDMVTWVRFLGLYISEGSVSSSHPNAVAIAQCTNKHRPFIESVLTAMGVRWWKNASGYEFAHGPLAAYLRSACYTGDIHRSWMKTIPQDVKDYPPGLLMELFDSLMRGDGHVEKNGLRRYITTSKVLAGDVIEVLQKSGGQGWMDLTQPGKTLARRVIYRVTERPKQCTRVPVPVSVEYDGMIHCVSVPNGIVYVRRNGRTAWCGNSVVEQALQDIDLYLRRLDWDKAQYTDGVQPAGWIKNTGMDTWTVPQLTNYNQAFNELYAGQTLSRQRYHLLPPGMEPVESKDHPEKFKPDYHLHLIKLVAMHFDMTVAELGFTEAKGLGSAGYHEGQADVQERKATNPDLRWLQAVLTEISRTHLGMPPELEFVFLGLDSEDEQAADEVFAKQVHSGGITVNEWREEMGRAPFDFKEADMPLVETNRGILFLQNASQTALPGELIQPSQQTDTERESEQSAGQDPATETGTATKAAYGSGDQRAERVTQQLTHDFPNGSLEWARDAKWEGPVQVPLSRLDFSNTDHWVVDPEKISGAQDRIQAGWTKPVILVQTPHRKHLTVVDGHHRSLAYRRLNQPVMAWIGRVNWDSGPWDLLHAKATDPELVKTELAAYSKWRKNGTSTRRPFTFQHLSRVDAASHEIDLEKVVFAE